MKAIVSIGFVFLSLALNAGAIAFSWTWFISPLGVPEIGYAHALGIGGLVSYMTNPTNVKTEKKEHWETIAIIVLRPVIFLAVAYLIKCFM